MSIDLFGNPCPPFHKHLGGFDPRNRESFDVTPAPLPQEDVNLSVSKIVDGFQRAENTPKFIPEVEKAMNESKSIAPPQKRHFDFSNVFILIVHYVGTLVLAGFNILFFLSLAPDRLLERVLFAVTGGVFAFGEVALWERGVLTHKWAPKLCALGLAVFSFLSAAAVSMQEVSAYQGNADAIASIESEIQESEEESRILRERIASMPANYATRAETLNRELDTKASSRNALRARLDALRANGKSEAKASSLFVAIADLFGLSVQSVALIFLVARSAMIEVVTLASSPRHIRNDSIKKD